MTKIKLCGLTRVQDIQAANELFPEYIGFVFAPKSRRYVSPEKASELRKLLCPNILAVGVFVNETTEVIANLLNRGIIDIAQLHGSEDDEYITRLTALSNKPLIKAFQIGSELDIIAAQRCTADYVLLDSGNGGTGTAFDWSLIQHIRRPYFLAGGLDTGNVSRAVTSLKPYAVDVSSGIETDGVKDINKMIEFVHAVRGVYRKEDIS